LKGKLKDMERLYLPHFGLAQAPFSITPDPAFFFAGADRGSLLRGIEFSVRHQEGITVVTGEVGSGKTMLCRTLLAGLPRDIEPIYLANPLLRRRELLATLLRDLEGDSQRPDLLDALQRVLIGRHMAGRRVVLFADEAQVMPRESLEQIRLLSNLETGRHKLLQIVLFGQPELDEVLAEHAMRPLRDRIVQRFTVAALRREAIGDYIAFRMVRAGRGGDSVFSRPAVNQIWDAASGLIRRINLLADKSLLSAFARRKQRVDCRDVERAVSDLDGTALAPERAERSTAMTDCTEPRDAGVATAGLLATVAALVAACAPMPPRPSDAHLTRASAPPTSAVTAASPNIPAAARRSWDLPTPTAQAAPERYTVVVNNMPAGDLLFQLARDAKMNVDVHPDIRGTVSLNAIDQTLTQILDRVSTQIDMRYTLEGNLLSVLPDAPFVRIYRVDYLNMGRDTTSRTSIATQVSTTGGNGVGSAGKGGDSTAGNNSGSDLVNTSNNRYWETLVASLKSLLQETDKILPGSDADKPEGRNERRSPGRGDGKGEGKGDSQADDKSQGVRFREAASVIAQPETGVIAVRATGRQHARVQEFIDSSQRSARRQVLIEATIAEVELSNAFEQGIDWKAIRNSATDTMGLTLSPAGSLTQLPGGSPVGGVIPTLGLINFSRSTARADITAALRLLESFGNTRVLSSPKISVLNNQTALIKVVENLVYFQLTADYTPGTAGSPSTFTVNSTPNTVPVGFLMNVTPQISGNDEIILNMRPTISRLTGYVQDPGVALSLALARQSGASIPDITSRVPEIQTREMESMIKLADGQIAVLGGLMREESTDSEDAVPGAKRVPVFGNLFRNRSRGSKKSELVIFLRPTIVRDASLGGDYKDLAHLLPDGSFLGATGTP
jgi:general secretion pathway protein D